MPAQPQSFVFLQSTTTNRGRRYNSMYYPTSTFMQAYTPPVYMTEGDEMLLPGGDGMCPEGSDSESVSALRPPAIFPPTIPFRPFKVKVMLPTLKGLYIMEISKEISTQHL